MRIGCDLEIKRDNEVLILRGTKGPWWAGVPLVAIPTFAVVSWIWNGAGGGVIAVLVMLMFVSIPLLFAIVPEKTTRFDLRARQVVLRWSFLLGLYEHHWTYHFDDIAGLAVKEFSGGDGWPFMPILMLRSGKQRSLAPVNGSYSAIAPILYEVGRVTGIETTDIRRDTIWS